MSQQMQASFTQYENEFLMALEKSEIYTVGVDLKCVTNQLVVFHPHFNKSFPCTTKTCSEESALIYNSISGDNSVLEMITPKDNS